MSIMNVRKGQVIARQKDTIKEWYLVQDGAVIRQYGFAQVPLGKNAIIGILESESFVCDYIAEEDSVLEVISCENADDLKKLLIDQPKYRGVFLHASIEQRHQLLSLYGNLQMKARQYHAFVLTLYNHYQVLCEKYQLEPLAFSGMEFFSALEMHHKVDQWEINQSISLVKHFLPDYLKLMGRDDSMTVGAILEASAQSRRCMQGVSEMVNYLNENKQILLTESENDFFHLFFDLAIRVGRRRMDVEPVKKEMFYLIGFIRKLKIYDEGLVSRRVEQYEAYDLGNTSGEFTSSEEIDIVSEDCLGSILEYAEIPKKRELEIRGMIDQFVALPDKQSTDTEVYQLRKRLTPMFFEVYEKVFMNAVRNEQSITPILEMFLNFGFMDVRLAGEEQSKELYELTGRMKRFSSDHIYTIYDWLKSIFLEINVPSKNEFDLDYPGYLLDQRKNGELTQEQVKDLMDDPYAKVRFEIHNMFTSGDRVTYGKITTFCPILCEYDLINSLEKMSVTIDRLEEELNKLRRIDYSLFYRELNFIGQGKDIMNHEMMNQEILPDIILMPNAGTKAMMWQETAGKTRDTSARFLFPIFTTADLEELMIETAARFRWEMCRKIQGVRWNDIREQSLTAEYCDYIQFYRKNRDLSADAKEKLKNALARAKNNYREVFVKDYQGWVKYESKGSFRLNKVAREILMRYCPFAKEIRVELKSNPTYQNSIPRLELENAKKVQRLNALYDKYERAGGDITMQMRENLMFYQL